VVVIVFHFVFSIGCCQCVEDVHHASTEHLLTGHSALHYAATDNADSAENEVEDNDYHGQMYGGDRIEWFKKSPKSCN
jgi:hypothetical protein